MAIRSRASDRWVSGALVITGALLAVSLVWRTATTPTGDAVAAAADSIIDVSVGIAFVAAGALSRGATWERVWIGATGVAWMAATWLPSLRGVHQGLLLAAVVLFARGIPLSAAQWVAAGVAAILMLGVWSQPLVAAVFLFAAIFALRGGRMRRRMNGLPSLSAGLVSAALGASWIASRLDPATFRPVVGLRVYEVSLIVAAALLAAGLVRVRLAGAMTDTLLRGDSATGLAGLERLLRTVLADADLTIVGAGERAAVVSESPLLRDDDTRHAVDEAVALASRHATLTDSLEQRRVALEGARRRLVSSVDRRRVTVAHRLRREVLEPLAESEALLRDARARGDDTERLAAIDIALREVESAQRDVMGMVRGIPPVTLGSGRIRSALADLAASAGPTVTIEAAGDAQGDETAELATFYVCSEALTNALRHSGATRIDVMLTVTDDEHLRLVVRDDGRGGAEPAPGSGLEGLSDRVSAAAGELRIDTGPHGTTVEVRLPVTTPAPRAAL